MTRDFNMDIPENLTRKLHAGRSDVFYLPSKLLLLVLYGVAAASYLTAIPLDAHIVQWVRIVGAVLLAVHLLEVVFCFKKVALHKGPLLDSVLLTLLFGFLHWKPMADAARRVH